MTEIKLTVIYCFYEQYFKTEKKELLAFQRSRYCKHFPTKSDPELVGKKDEKYNMTVTDTFKKRNKTSERFGLKSNAHFSTPTGFGL